TCRAQTVQSWLAGLDFQECPLVASARRRGDHTGAPNRKRRQAAGPRGVLLRQRGRRCQSAEKISSTHSAVDQLISGKGQSQGATPALTLATYAPKSRANRCEHLG